MTKPKPYGVVFAGVQGTSKTIIAQHLSYTFNLPIFRTDTVRHEVKEDMLVDSINIPEALAEYERRYDARHGEILKRGKPMIFDNSVDRRWGTIKPKLQTAGFTWYLISLDLSRQFIETLYAKTGRAKAIEKLDRYFQQHEEFVAKYSGDINLKITDDMFLGRLEYAVKGLKQFIKDL
jgi:hypothetical protein